MQTHIKNKRESKGESGAGRTKAARGGIPADPKAGTGKNRAKLRRVRVPAGCTPDGPLPFEVNHMQENYVISIRGRQKVDDEVGEIELTTVGSYVRRGSSRYIVYKEYMADQSPSTRTSILKIDGDSRLTLMRHGGDNTRLILENGKRHLCQYDTEYGNMMIGVFTSRLSSHLGDTGGSLEVIYTLDINSALSSLNELSITVKEAKNTDVQNRAAGD